MHEPLADCLNSLLESTVTSLVFEPSSDRNHFHHFETDKVTVLTAFQVCKWCYHGNIDYQQTKGFQNERHHVSMTFTSSVGPTVIHIGR